MGGVLVVVVGAKAQTLRTRPVCFVWSSSSWLPFLYNESKLLRKHISFSITYTTYTYLRCVWFAIHFPALHSKCKSFPTSAKAKATHLLGVCSGISKLKRDFHVDVEQREIGLGRLGIFAFCPPALSLPAIWFVCWFVWNECVGLRCSVSVYNIETIC